MVKTPDAPGGSASGAGGLVQRRRSGRLRVNEGEPAGPTGVGLRSRPQRRLAEKSQRDARGPFGLTGEGPVTGGT
jgi:hypothetical protein